MLNKQTNMTLETNSKVVQKNDTNITFYDTDIGTATFMFTVTRHNKPIRLSEEHTKSTVMIEFADGSYLVDEAKVVDPIKKPGLLEYTIPTEFLAHNGKATGQVLIAANGQETIVTEVKFNFHIEEHLLSKKPAVDKIVEFKNFAQLRQRIDNIVAEINEKVDKGKDYVTELESLYEAAMKNVKDFSERAITDLEEKSSEINNNIEEQTSNHMQGMENRFVEISKDIEQLNNYDTSNWQKYKMTNDDGSRIWLQGLDPLTAEPGYYETSRMENGPMNGDSGFFYVDITPSSNGRRLIKATYSAGNRSFIKTVHTNGKETEWKEITSTNTRQWLGTLGSEESGYNSVLDLPPGLYECEIPPDAFEVNAPLDPNGAGYIASIDVYEGNDKRKQIKLVGNYRNDVYHATVHTKNEDNPNGNFRGWHRVMNAEEFEAKNTDTGWIEWNTKNGATKREADDEQAIGCHYRIKTINGTKFGFLRINVNNVETQMIVGEIPKEAISKTENFYARTPVSMSPAVITIGADGVIKVYLNLNDIDKWVPSHYLVGEFSWIIDDKGSGI